MGQEQDKYHVSNDGKVFRINEDGSFTELGNAEDRQYPTNYAPTVNSKGPRHKWPWLIILVIIIVAIIYGIYVTYEYIYSINNVHPSTNNTVYDCPDQKTQNTMIEDNAQWAFIKDGNFYGTIGKVRIHGHLNIDNIEGPTGVLYYTDTGNGKALKIKGPSDGKTWYEYYNGDCTGIIHFSFWNLVDENFARGTYTRNSDGKQFSIELYKTNF